MRNLIMAVSLTLLLAGISSARREEPPPPEDGAIREGCSRCLGTLCKQECERGILRLHFTAPSGTRVPACPEEPTVVLHCDPYVCDPEGHGCKEVCQSDSECSAGYVCDDTHLPSLGQCLPYIFTCDGDSTLTAPNGDQVSCAPYRCKGAQCISACSTTADCVPGFVCDVDGHCVVPEN